MRLSDCPICVSSPKWAALAGQMYTPRTGCLIQFGPLDWLVLHCHHSWLPNLYFSHDSATLRLDVNKSINVAANIARMALYPFAFVATEVACRWLATE